MTLLKIQDVSRGLLLSQIIHNERWWKGPHFLSLDRSLWPQLKPGDDFSRNDSKEETVNLFVKTEFEYSELSNDQKIKCLAVNPDINLVVFDKLHFVSEYNDNLEKEEIIDDTCSESMIPDVGEYK